MSRALSTLMRVMPAGVGRSHGSGHQRHVGAGLARRRGHREAHLSRAAVGQIAHRIERLAGRAGGDQHIETGQQARVRRRFEEARRELVRFPHAALADLATGLVAGGGSEHAHAAGHQGVDVRLGRLVGPHDPVHGRRQHDRRLGGEAQRREQIVGAAARQACDEVRAGRRDQHHLRPARQLDVAHGRLGRRVPQVGARRTAGNGLKGQPESRIAVPPAVMTTWTSAPRSISRRTSSGLL